MTPLEQKLNQLSLTTMSRQLDDDLADAAAKNLSVAATLECSPTWNWKPATAAPSSAASSARRLQAQPSIDGFHFHHHKSRMQGKTASCACSI